MFAIVESGSITSMPRGNKGIQIGDIKHSADILQISGLKVKEMLSVFIQ